MASARRPPGYERTCQRCGCRWQVPREVASIRKQRNPEFRYLGRGFLRRRPQPKRPSLPPDIATFVGTGEGFFRCPACSSTDWEERELPDYTPPV